MVVVFSGGRSGTNLVLEILTGHSSFCPSDYPEDKLIFTRNVVYPDCYLTKCDTIYCSNYDTLNQFMSLNSKCKMIWTVRHPYDWAMSKIYRGRPLPKRHNKPADDFNPEICIQDLYYVIELHSKCIKDFPSRNITVKLEDIIDDIEMETKRLCDWLGIEFENSMLKPWERMRHQGKRERYGNKLDRSQLYIHKNLDEIYNGYFKWRKYIYEVFNSLNPVVDYFKY